MGVTGVGKSSFISLFAEENVVIGHSLEACKNPDLDPERLCIRDGDMTD